MKENNDNSCSNTLKIIQMRKNSAFHSGILQSPREVLFGRKSVYGLSSSILHPSVAENIKTITELKSGIK